MSRSARILMASVLVAVAVPIAFAQPAAAARVKAVDKDTANKLWDCEQRHIDFGVAAEDRLRCFTFRYSVPPGGVTSAYLHVDVGTLGGLSDTDALVMAVGTSFPDCLGLQGAMGGCIGLHGGFSAGNVALNLNLLDIACDKSIQGSPEKQAAVTAQLNSGVAHFLLQDDTVVNGAELVLNEGSVDIQCGATNTAANPATGGTPGSTGTTPGGTSPCALGPSGAPRGSIPGDQLGTPPFGTEDPCTAVSRMTLQAGQRNVVAGGEVWVPVWMIKGANVANLNFEMAYDTGVVAAVRGVNRGSFFSTALQQANTEEAGIARFGYAQTTGENGTGPVAWIKFKAVGRPGDRTSLRLSVTSLNEPGGSIVPIDRIDGLVQIVGPDGMLPGDCDGNGILSEVDALCALQMSVKLVPESLVLDLDKNQAVNSRDSTLILQKAVGK